MSVAVSQGGISRTASPSLSSAAGVASVSTGPLKVQRAAVSANSSPAQSPASIPLKEPFIRSKSVEQTSSGSVRVATATSKPIPITAGAIAVAVIAAGHANGASAVRPGSGDWRVAAAAAGVGGSSNANGSGNGSGATDVDGEDAAGYHSDEDSIGFFENPLSGAPKDKEKENNKELEQSNGNIRPEASVLSTSAPASSATSVPFNSNNNNVHQRHLSDTLSPSSANSSALTQQSPSLSARSAPSRSTFSSSSAPYAMRSERSLTQAQSPPPTLNSPSQLQSQSQSFGQNAPKAPPIPFGLVRGVPTAALQSNGSNIHVPVSNNVNEVLAALRREQKYDFLQLGQSVEFRRFMENCTKHLQSDLTVRMETLQFSDSVIKINRRDKRQQRDLVLTNKALYNFAPRAYRMARRRITLASLHQIVLSRCSNEMVFQIHNSYDYRMEIAHRAELLEMIQKNVQMDGSKEIKVNFTEEKELKEHVTTKPLMKFRNLSTSTQQRDTADSRAGSQSNSANSPQSASSAHRSSNSFSGTSSTSAPQPAVEVFFPLTCKRGLALEGWLTKKKGKSDKFERKYFVLLGEYIEYYTPKIFRNFPMQPLKFDVVEVNHMDSQSSSDVDKAKEKTDHQTSNAAAANAPSSNVPNAPPPPPHPLLMHRIRILSKTSRAELDLAAESVDDKLRWLHALRARLHKDRKGYYHFEGWLMKREGKTWRRCYCILDGDRLWLFAMALKGRIDLIGGISVHTPNLIQATEKDGEWAFCGEIARTRFAYRFNISDSQRIFYCAADSADDMNLWLKEIKRASRQLQRAVEIGSGLGKAAAAGNANHAHQPQTHAHGAVGPVPADSANVTPSVEKTVVPLEFFESIEQEPPTGNVALVFTDVQNSTTLWEKCPDAMDIALEIHDRILREILRKYNGYEVKTEGDAFMVAFFTVLDAVCWCMEVQLQLNQQAWSEELLGQKAAQVEYAAESSHIKIFSGLRVRMGIHCGPCNARRNPVTGRMDYFGNAVNRSARVNDAAHGGQIVCTKEVVDSVLASRAANDPKIVSRFPAIDDLGSHWLKGIEGQVRIFQIRPTQLTFRKFPPLRTSAHQKTPSVVSSSSSSTATNAAAPAGISISINAASMLQSTNSNRGAANSKINSGFLQPLARNGGNITSSGSYIQAHSQNHKHGIYGAGHVSSPVSARGHASAGAAVRLSGSGLSSGRLSVPAPGGVGSGGVADLSDPVSTASAVSACGSELELQLPPFEEESEDEHQTSADTSAPTSADSDNADYANH